MVPKGWSVQPVGNLFDVQLGKMLNQEAKEKFPQYKYLGNSNVKWGGFDLSDLKMMHFSQKDISKFSLEIDDILMCEGGEVGRCAIWQGSEETIFYQKAIHRLRSNGKIIPKFFQFYMEKIAGTKLLDDYSTKTSIAHLTQEKLVTLPVRLPPLTEQKKIAQILSAWDKAITTTEKLLANSQQQKKALMEQLLTGKNRLLDGNGRRFKGEWKQVLISDICKIGRGRVISKIEIESNPGEYPVYSSQTSKDGVMGHLNSFDFNGEYVTWTTDGINAGTVFYRTGKFNCTNVCGTLSAHDNTISLKFLAFALSMVAYKYVSHTLANPKLMNGVMASIKVKIPKIEEQNKIACVLFHATQQILVIENNLKALKAEKKALMQQLLTGKRRVLAKK